jgi:hypothetical protein
MTSIWRSGQGAYYVIPEDCELDAGPVRITDFSGRSRGVAPDALIAFEVTEEQAHRWAKDELGKTLGELKDGIDEKLRGLRAKLEAVKSRPVKEGAAVTPDAPSALLSLLKQLPGVIGQSLSGEDGRVEDARNTMVDLQRRLKESGIDLDDRFTRFPDRLAELRKDAERQRKQAAPPPEEEPKV